jgi:hypothetical protein
MADWGPLVAEHSAALQEFVLLARRVSPDQWNKPIAPGKWTPAEIVSHLSESYQVLRGELAGSPGMELRLSRLSTDADAFVQELFDPSRRSARLTHAYFGAMSARQSLRLVTVHTRHHARQIAAVS